MVMVFTHGIQKEVIALVTELYVMSKEVKFFLSQEFCE